MAGLLCRLVVAALVLCSSASLATQIGPPVQNLKTFEGRAEMRSEGGRVTVNHLGAAGETLQRFKIELSGAAELPASLDIEAPRTRPSIRPALALVSALIELYPSLGVVEP